MTILVNLNLGDLTALYNLYIVQCCQYILDGLTRYKERLNLGFVQSDSTPTPNTLSPFPIPSYIINGILNYDNSFIVYTLHQSVSG